MKNVQWHEAEIYKVGLCFFFFFRSQWIQYKKQKQINLWVAFFYVPGVDFIKTDFSKLYFDLKSDFLHVLHTDFCLTLPIHDINEE